MASTTVLSGLELTKWQAKFMREYVRDSGFDPYMGEALNSIICVKNDLQSDGYTIRVPLVSRLTGNGVSGNTTLSGTEEALGQYFFDVTWEYYRHAITLTKKEREKSANNLMEVVRPLLKEWASELVKFQLIDCFHKIDGTVFASAAAGARNTWLTNNADRVLFGSAKANASSNVHATALATVDSAADKLSTAVASLAKRIARAANPHIKPYISETYGREYYVMFCHPFCFRDLKADTVMQQANRDARAREGDAMDKNPLFQDGDLIYDGIIFREIPEFYSARTTGVNTSTHLAGVGTTGIDVGVNFLCGQQSLVFANKQLPMPTDKTETDYGFVIGKGIELAHGIEKARWANGSGTTKDNGIVTVYCSATPDT